jgi:benzoyl-CoA reductase/2-hydroxyglutaryl-CoA dehydratase subunit BcrC/BadD/HgdB
VGLGLKPWRAVVAGSERAGEALVRPDLCPFVKSVLGGIVTSSGEFGSVDAWAGMYTCDMTRRLFQELERLSGKTVFPLQLPSTRTPEAARWFCESVRTLALGLIKAGFSSGYDPAAALAWETDRLFGAAALRAAALSFRVPPVALQELFHGFFVENRFPASVVPGDLSPRVRVAVTGSVIARGDDVVAETLSELGAGYLPLGCTGLSGLPSTVPPDGSIEALALASFNDTRCIRNRPNHGVFDWITEQVELGGCHGLVLKTLSFCDLWHTEKERFRNMPFPVLVLSSDLSPGERGRTSVRLQAFVETLEARNE